VYVYVVHKAIILGQVDCGADPSPNCFTTLTPSNYASYQLLQARVAANMVLPSAAAPATTAPSSTPVETAGYGNGHNNENYDWRHNNGNRTVPTTSVGNTSDTYIREWTALYQQERSSTSYGQFGNNFNRNHVRIQPSARACIIAPNASSSYIDGGSSTTPYEVVPPSSAGAMWDIATPMVKKLSEPRSAPSASSPSWAKKVVPVRRFAAPLPSGIPATESAVSSPSTPVPPPPTATTRDT
jgi:hypothetical protein